MSQNSEMGAFVPFKINGKIPLQSTGKLSRKTDHFSSFSLIFPLVPP